ncbi:MAG: YgdI/YgdR family lipoprotein [Gammaproteobacteria bacterium]
MKSTARYLAIGIVVALSGCASSEYLIVLNDGTTLPVVGNPRLDDETGFYTYWDEKGREGRIAKGKVGQIIER